jgi:hypothetical protein
MRTEFHAEGECGERKDLLPDRLPQNSVESQKRVFKRAPETSLTFSPRVFQNRFRREMSAYNGLIVAEKKGPQEFIVILDLKESETAPSERALRQALKMWPELNEEFVFRSKTGGASVLQQSSALLSQNWIIYSVSRYSIDVVNAYIEGRYDPQLIRKDRFEPIQVFFTGKGFGISGDTTYLKNDLIEAGCTEAVLQHPVTGKSFNGLHFRGGEMINVREALKETLAYNAVIFW